MNSLITAMCLTWAAYLLFEAWVFHKKRIALEKKFREHVAAFEDAQRKKNIALMRLHNEQCEAIVEEMKKL